MREHKYRAWDKRLKFYTYSWVYVEGLMDFFAEIHNHDVVLQQWTGLKDKNNNDIYEGDLILDIDAPDKSDRIPRIVEWRKDTFRCPFVRHHWAWGYSLINLDAVINRCVVIGNMYENPELLDS